jgi:hypothetical protein
MKEMKVTIEFVVDHFEWEGFAVGLPVTLDELTHAAGSDLDAVVVKIETRSGRPRSRWGTKND